jgi:hypothetical protein
LIVVRVSAQVEPRTIRAKILPRIITQHFVSTGDNESAPSKGFVVPGRILGG